MPACVVGAPLHSSGRIATLRGSRGDSRAHAEEGVAEAAAAAMAFRAAAPMPSVAEAAMKAAAAKASEGWASSLSRSKTRAEGKTEGAVEEERETELDHVSPADMVSPEAGEEGSGSPCFSSWLPLAAVWSAAPFFASPAFASPARSLV